MLFGHLQRPFNKVSEQVSDTIVDLVMCLEIVFNLLIVSCRTYGGLPITQSNPPACIASEIPAASRMDSRALVRRYL